GWLEVFRGSGANWSYVQPAPGPEPWALATAEKQPISDLCCTGLYHFARAEDFRAALAAERAAPQAAELYVAPLYNHLLAQGRRVAWCEIDRDEVVFCGTPAEYEALK
ncbi:MAG: capsular polysaccharide biosynthesis protein, partial [Phenylobacterium sp.]|nr:capsular polysaccharide biosynthesis protein [Phenylobacterium sp.]